MKDTRIAMVVCSGSKALTVILIGSLVGFADYMRDDTGHERMMCSGLASVMTGDTCRRGYG